MFSNVDRLAMSHGSLFWVLGQTLKQRVLQTREVQFSVFTDKSLKTAEFKHMEKCFILTEIVKSVIVI